MILILFGINLRHLFSSIFLGRILMASLHIVTSLYVYNNRLKQNLDSNLMFAFCDPPANQLRNAGSRWIDMLGKLTPSLLCVNHGLLNYTLIPLVGEVNVYPFMYGSQNCKTTRINNKIMHNHKEHRVYVENPQQEKLWGIKKNLLHKSTVLEFKTLHLCLKQITLFLEVQRLTYKYCMWKSVSHHQLEDDTKKNLRWCREETPPKIQIWQIRIARESSWW